jgi:TolC family type I secretion outer membrane protein
VAAETLIDALVDAYQRNPTLEAQRARLRSVNENLPQALSGWRPTVRLSADAGRQTIDTTPSTRRQPEFRSPNTVSLVVSQPIYRGGRTIAGTNRAENQIRAERARTQLTEQTVLLDVATAYVNVVRDQAVVDLNVSNEQVLRRNLDAVRDRFEVGEVTRTDVSQAESRLARATADRIQAEGALASSRAAYQRLVGRLPGVLEAPSVPGNLPTTRDGALTTAGAENPNVVFADYTERAARDDVDVTVGELRPTVSLDGTLSRAEETSATGIEAESARITATLTMPLYQSGSVASRVRQSKEVASQRLIEVDVARRAATESAARAWDSLQTTRASIISIEAQIRAAEIALAGVREESAVGSRTVLDVLDAEQELLNARVNLVRSRRDEIVAAFDLNSAVGRLTAGALGLPVQVQDIEEHYRQVRGRWWEYDTDVNERQSP